MLRLLEAGEAKIQSREWSPFAPRMFSGAFAEQKSPQFETLIRPRMGGRATQHCTPGRSPLPVAGAPTLQEILVEFG